MAATWGWSRAQMDLRIKRARTRKAIRVVAVTLGLLVAGITPGIVHGGRAAPVRASAPPPALAQERAPAAPAAPAPNSDERR